VLKEREQHAMVALAIARRFEDRDLEFSAQALLGHTYVAVGRVAEGMSLIDEAMAAVFAGEVARIDSIGELLEAAGRLRARDRRQAR
jgi:hypothetical protein